MERAAAQTQATARITAEREKWLNLWTEKGGHGLRRVEITKDGNYFMSVATTLDESNELEECICTEIGLHHEIPLHYWWLL
jgi:hypothetical protein